MSTVGSGSWQANYAPVAVELVVDITTNVNNAGSHIG